MKPNLEKVPPQLREASARLISQSKGLGITHKQAPVSVMLPPKIDTIVRAMPNRSDFIREAISEKLEREKLSEKEKHISILDHASLEAIRDSLLMKKPPKERRKLKAVLDAFIKELA